MSDQSIRTALFPEFLLIHKNIFRPKFVAGVSNSVSFRQGTNVEFEGPSFVEGGAVQPGAGTGGVADNRDFSNPMYDMGGGGGGGSAVLAPSSVQHASPALSGTGDTKQPRELSPVTIDTGKDTQCLVAEDDSEC